MTYSLLSRNPPVLWAQRKDKLFVTIRVEDCNDPNIDLQESKLIFKGTGGAEKNLYEVTIPFCEAVIPQESKKSLGARELYFVIKKKEEAWWPRLLKEKVKTHWLKTDFSKWKDEDDSDPDDGADDFSLNEMMNKMGGVGEDADENEEDSDDESLPDLED